MQILSILVQYIQTLQGAWTEELLLWRLHSLSSKYITAV